MNKTGVLIHHHEGILTHEFLGVTRFCEAKIVAVDLIMNRFRFARYENTPVLIYPFMQKKGYDPEKLATGIAFEALAVNENNFYRLPDFPLYGSIKIPDLICRGCGNLALRYGSKSEYQCLSMIRQKNMNFRLNAEPI